MDDENKKHSCCFFGHRKINEMPELIERLTRTVESLITDKGANTFYFGSKSEFDDLCHKVVTKLKKNIHISNGYMSGQHSNISPTGMKKVYLIITRVHTFPNIWRRLAEHLMWNAIKR